MNTLTIKMGTYLFLSFLVLTFCAQDSRAQQGKENETLSTEVLNDTTQLRRMTREQKGKRAAVQAHNRLETIALDKKQNDVAETEYLEAYRQSRYEAEKMEAAYKLGVISFRKEKFPESERYLNEYLNSHPAIEEAEWTRYYLLRLQFKQDDPQYVPSVRAHFSSQHPVTASKDVMLRYYLLRYLTDHLRFKEALDEAKTIVTTFPGDSLARQAN